MKVGVTIFSMHVVIRWPINKSCNIICLKMALLVKVEMIHEK